MKETIVKMFISLLLPAAMWLVNESMKFYVLFDNYSSQMIEVMGACLNVPWVVTFIGRIQHIQ